VGDFMTIDPIVIAPDASIEEAEHLLATFRISGLPVVDPAGRPLGVLSQSDLVAASASELGRVIRGQASGLRVGELMSSPALTVPLLATLGEAAGIMRDARVHRVVAVDDHGRAVGVLSASDYVALYADRELTTTAPRWVRHRETTHAEPTKPAGSDLLRERFRDVRAGGRVRDTLLGVALDALQPYASDYLSRADYAGLVRLVDGPVHEATEDGLRALIAALAIAVTDAEPKQTTHLEGLRRPLRPGQ
jgi:CBS domain-containing protein